MQIFTGIVTCASMRVIMLTFSFVAFASTVAPVTPPLSQGVIKYSCAIFGSPSSSSLMLPLNEKREPLFQLENANFINFYSGKVS